MPTPVSNGYWETPVEHLIAGGIYQKKEKSLEENLSRQLSLQDRHL
jgi:hypothetical protein